MIYIEDNFLTEEEMKVVNEEVLGDTFPWYRLPIAVSDAEHPCPFMGHIIIGISGYGYLEERINSDWFYFFGPIMKRAYEKYTGKDRPDFQRMCINDTFNYPFETTGIHQDHAGEFPHWNALLYLTDSSGVTYLYDDSDGEPIQAIEPKAGRLAFWDGLQYWHAQQPKQDILDRRVAMVTTITKED